MATDENTTITKPSLHPVYTVHNIQHKVCVLDGTKVSYASWVHLLKLHARGYKVLHHIDGTEPPAKTDPDYNEWCEIDSHVLQWIYGTLSDDLLARVLTGTSTAYAAWSRVKNIFVNNKGARAASLEHEFTNLKLESLPSLEAYCQRLRELAGQLSDVDAPVTEQRLVIQLLRGLPSSYDTVASYINQALPDFETARNMLELERHRQSSCEEHPTALVTPHSPQNNTTSWSASSAPRPEKFHRRGNGRRGSGHRGNSTTGHHTPGRYPPWSQPPHGCKIGHHLHAPIPQFPVGLMLGITGPRYHLPNPPPPTVTTTNPFNY
ncbi:hypothetical protein vseg_015259 [Gypsophila vaccaria]